MKDETKSLSNFACRKGHPSALRRAGVLMLTAVFFLQLCSCAVPAQNEGSQSNVSSAPPQDGGDVSQQQIHSPEEPEDPPQDDNPPQNIDLSQDEDEQLPEEDPGEDPEEDPEDSEEPDPEETPAQPSTPAVTYPPYSEEALNQVVQSVLNRIITSNMTKLQQARAVYDYTRRNISYVGTSDKSDWMRGAYTGLTTRRGDCFTYYAVARALLTALGIDNMEIHRENGATQHFWNLVNCGDGWYHMDATPRSVRMPSFDSFMFTDEDAAAYTEVAGRLYYNFNPDLYPRSGSNDPIPGETVDPEDPGEVVDPENPENPGDPGEAVDPENPENPGEMVDPENPENPGEMVDPENPENPGETVDTENPENPGETVDPENPENPGETENPENPENPGETVDPENPENPGETVDPEDSDIVTDPLESDPPIYEPGPAIEIMEQGSEDTL